MLSFPHAGLSLPQRRKTAEARRLGMGAHRGLSRPTTIGIIHQRGATLQIEK